MFRENRGMNSRESIMMRDQRQYISPTNMTTGEIQYQKEQRKLEAKRRRRANLSNDRRIAICGSKHERVNAQNVVKKQMDELVAIKQLHTHNERKDDRDKVNFAVAMEEGIFERERKKKLEKREQLRLMMEENKRLVRMKKMKEKELKDKEKERSKEVEFFDKYKSYL